MIGTLLNRVLGVDGRLLLVLAITHPAVTFGLIHRILVLHGHVAAKFCLNLSEFLVVWSQNSLVFGRLKRVLRASVRLSLVVVAEAYVEVG